MFKNWLYTLCFVMPFALVRHYTGEQLREKIELPNQVMSEHLVSYGRELATVEEYGRGDVDEPEHGEESLSLEEEEDEEEDEEEIQSPALRGSRTDSRKETEPEVEGEELRREEDEESIAEEIEDEVSGSQEEADPQTESEESPVSIV